jgi:phage repressor protein C with HTH and peptisase S24 domain
MFEHVLRALLADGKAVRFRASGTSMAPAIRDGETVIVEAHNRLRRGDVVLFREPRSARLLAHRIVSVRSDGLILRGDAAEGWEGPVGPAMIVGRILGVERGGAVHSLGSPRIYAHLLLRRIRMVLGIRRGPSHPAG